MCLKRRFVEVYSQCFVYQIVCVCVCVYECFRLNILGYLYVLVLLSVKPISLGDSLLMWPVNLSISPYISFN